MPNTYDPILYPNLPIRGVYLNSVHDLNFEGTNISLSDATTTPGETGDGRPLTGMKVGPLFDTQSLSLSLIFLDPTLVSPLSSDPLAYEGSFVSFQSVLFPQIPPPRTHVDPLLTLTVNEVPAPTLGGVSGMLALGIIALMSVIRLFKKIFITYLAGAFQIKSLRDSGQLVAPGEREPVPA